MHPSLQDIPKVDVKDPWQSFSEAPEGMPSFLEYLEARGLSHESFPESVWSGLQLNNELMQYLYITAAIREANRLQEAETQSDQNLEQDLETRALEDLMVLSARLEDQLEIVQRQIAKAAAERSA